MASKYIQKFPVPEGFPEILHDLSKEILRNQPEDIIEFSAMYFKCLQEKSILDYANRGKNIPCDFQPTVPTTSTKDQHNAGKKAITRQDEIDHEEAVERSNNLHDAAKVHHKEEEKKELKEAIKEDTFHNQSQHEEKEKVETVEEKVDEEVIKTISYSFVNNIMDKIVIELKHSKNKFKFRYRCSIQNYKQK
jgi:hypothetical protein